MDSVFPIPWKVISVGLLFKGSKILLGLRYDKEGENKAVWEFPGGSVELGENPQDSMIREMKEELDIEVKESELATCLCDYKKESSRIIVFFYVHHWEGEVRKTCHKKLTWFSLKECLEQKIPNINPNLFEDIVSVLNKRIESSR